MKLNCNIVDDLLPLYLEDICSEDSKAALEKHLQECSACREKLARMKSSDILYKVEKLEGQLPIAEYARKVKRHRVRIGILAVLFCAIAACILALCGLAIIDMHRQANPTVYEVEEGTYNLTAANLNGQAEEIEQYVFYTNSTQIQVKVQGDGNFRGTVMLWSTEDTKNFIQIGEINERTNTVTFTGCSAARRYRITCDNLEGATVTVSEGRTVNFWNSMWNVLQEIF